MFFRVQVCNNQSRHITYRQYFRNVACPTASLGRSLNPEYSDSREAEGAIWLFDAR